MSFASDPLIPALVGLSETLLPDFALGLTFFTAVTYGALSKRFGHQRTAAAISVVLGMALTVGMVWWEYDHDWSIRQLGPVAIILAILILAGTVYHAVRQIGGSWAGVGITLGVSILIILVLDMDLPVAVDVMGTVAMLALMIGLISFLTYHHRTGINSIPSHMSHVSQYPIETDETRQEIAQLHRDRWLSGHVTRGLRRLRKEAELLTRQPEEVPNVADQIKRLLPAEGWLTQRMASLRAKAHHVRKGHLARLEETKHICRSLDPSAKRRIASDLVRRYHQLAGIDKRLERLDKAVASNERKVRHLTVEAEQATMRHDFQELVKLLEQAGNLQGHNEKVFKAIERTERKLAGAAQTAERDAQEVTDP